MNAQFTRFGKQRIVDIGDIAYAANRVSEIDQAPLNDVVKQES